MKWNWQQTDWPNWEFDSSKLQASEEAFLLHAGKLSGALEYMRDSEKLDIQIKLLGDEAVTTSEIEGEYLDRVSVQSSLQRKFGMKADTKSSKAENGIAELMMDCFTHFDRPLTHEVLFAWHEMICGGRRDLEHIGSYRTHPDPMQVVSGSVDRIKVHFEAPPSDQVPREMDRFLEWLASEQLGVLTKAAITHLYFVSIHPFEDGNGRIARALCEQVFAQVLGRPSFTTLSRQIERTKSEYYEMLASNNMTMQIQGWIEWFAQTALEAQQYALGLIGFTIRKAQILEDLRGQVNDRQMKVLLRLFDAGPEGFSGGLSAANYMKITDAPISTTTRDLAHLVKLGVLKRTGERKSTRYWLVGGVATSGK